MNTLALQLPVTGIELACASEMPRIVVLPQRRHINWQLHCRWAIALGQQKAQEPSSF